MPIRTAWDRVTWSRIPSTSLRSQAVQDAVGRLLTVREVADRLRVSRATVYRLVHAGALPVLRVSNSIRIPEAAPAP
jgi:excisionase family DNA binding protein